MIPTFVIITARLWLLCLAFSSFYVHDVTKSYRMPTCFLITFVEQNLPLTLGVYDLLCRLLGPSPTLASYASCSLMICWRLEARIIWIARITCSDPAPSLTSR